MSMSDEQFEDAMDFIGGYTTMVADLRARDTAQREAIERLQGELDEYISSVPGIENERDNLRERLAGVEMFRDSAIANHFQEMKVTRDLQTQLAEAVGLLRKLGSLPHAWQNDQVAINAFLARHAQAEQQEAQGAQAGDECPVCLGDGAFYVCIADAVNTDCDACNGTGRAALATQPAAGEPIAWIHEDELPEGYPYDAMFPFSKVDFVRMFPVFGPPAAAHGDEAVLPDNLRSHRLSWLNAMERLIELEPGGLDPTAEDLNGYWCHELQAMRDMYADLDRIEAMRAQGDGEVQ